MPGFSALPIAVALFAIPLTGIATEPWEFFSSGLVDIRLHGSDDNTTELVPDPERIGIDAHALSITTVAELKGWNGPMTVAGRLRAQGASADRGRSGQGFVDELYAEYAVTLEHFLYLGRRHIVYGQSLGVNPLDIALDLLVLDRSKNETRRRSEIEGQDLFGFESLLDHRFTLSGYWVPGERALLAGTLTLPALKSDLTGIVFDDARPGAGLSFARTLGQAAVIYGDLAIRKGRDRMVIRTDNRPGRPPGAFLAEESDDDRLFPQLSIGASYTLESGVTWNIEYYFDANGYSSGEWDEILRLIAQNNAARRDALFGGLPVGNLLQINGLLRSSTLRRHYGFLRMAHPRLLGNILTAETTVLHNLADHSGALGVRLEHALGPNLLLGAQGRYFYGEDLDEFALRTGKLSGSVYITVNF